MTKKISVAFSSRDRLVLFSLPAVMWLASCLYFVLINANALPPGLSPNSPLSMRNATLLGLCFLLTYPIIRLGHIVLGRHKPDWSVTTRTGAISMVALVLGAAAMLASALWSGGGSVANLKFYVISLAAGMAMMPAFFFLIRTGDIVREQITTVAGINPVRNLLRKVGPDAGTKLVRLQSADHYLQVSTEAGEGLILMRLGDAVDSLSGVSGAQVHRSHWVNFTEVTDIIKRDRKVWLRMSDGFDVPVARSYRPALRAAGVL